jgi:hypothetical protein
MALAACMASTGSRVAERSDGSADAGVERGAASEPATQGVSPPVPDLPPAPAPPRADHPPRPLRAPPDAGAADAGAPDAPDSPPTTK